MLAGTKVPAMPEEMIFSSSMSEEDFLKWLKSKRVSDRDHKTLVGRIHRI
jgi:hypothetical protein